MSQFFTREEQLEETNYFDRYLWRETINGVGVGWKSFFQAATDLIKEREYQNVTVKDIRDMLTEYEIDGRYSEDDYDEFVGNLDRIENQ